MNLQTDRSYRDLSRALRQVITRPKLAQELKSRETRPETMQKLGITEEVATEIFNILNVLDRHREEGAGENSRTPPSMESAGIESDREFLMESFRQLRSAYRISMIMSVVVFVIGMGFLVIAAIRAFTNPESVAVTSVIGGIGVVQIVALFYRNPLADVARTVSNAQQAKIAVMSYLIGVTLVNQQIGLGKPSDEHLGQLVRLTEAALLQLQKYTEEDASAHTREKNSGE